MIKSLIVKNILSAIAVAVCGFILLNLAFVFDYLVHESVTGAIRLFTSIDPLAAYSWFPPFMHVLFVIIIGLISWPILRSRLGVFYKATYMTVPLAVVLVTIGMFLNRWPWLVIMFGGIFSASVLIYLIRTKRPWLYSFSLIFVSLVLLIMTILGVDI